MDKAKATEQSSTEPQVWRVGSSTFRALPEKGARLMDWQITFGAGQVRRVLHWPDDADLENPARVRGGNPILFPFAGPSFHKGVPGQWRPKQKRDALPMPQHGFARSGRFRLLETHTDGFAAELEPDAAAKASYPYDYAFRVRYRFEELAFTVTLELENRDEVPIPWAAGHHFYFQLPWHEGAFREDYELQLDARRAAYLGPDGALVPDKTKLARSHFDNPALIERIHTHLKSSLVEFGPRGGEENVQLRIAETPVPQPWAAVLTWTESAQSPFFCVEPWMGPPNAAEHGKGLHFVNPGESEAWTVQVSLF